jgi:hypothetical protein
MLRQQAARAAAQTGALQCVDSAFTPAADKPRRTSVPQGKPCLPTLSLQKRAAPAANMTAQIALRARLCDRAIRFAAQGRFYENHR